VPFTLIDRIFAYFSFSGLEKKLKEFKTRGKKIIMLVYFKREDNEL
jgi:hypothetical protein